MTPESTLDHQRPESTPPIEDEFFARLTNTKDAILIPDLNLLYQRVPKVAGTSISKLLLHYLFNDPEGKTIGKANVHYIVGTLLPAMTDYPKKYIYDKLHSDDFFKFTFVRNPYAKLVSCYKDKIERLAGIRKVVEEATLIAKAMEFQQPHFYEEPKYIIYNAKMRAASGKDPFTPYSSKFEVATFEDFAQFVCTQEDQEMEHHWEPQVRTTNWGLVNYNLVGKQETYERDMHIVLNMLYAPSFLHNLVSERHNATAKTTIASYYTPDLQQLVYGRYKEDFLAFGYDSDLPEY